MTVYVRSIDQHVYARTSHALVQFSRHVDLPPGADPEAAMWADVATSCPLSRERAASRYNATWQEAKTYLEGRHGLYIVCDSALMTFMLPNDRPLTVPILAAVRDKRSVVAVLARDYLADKASLLRIRAGVADREAEVIEGDARRTWPWRRRKLSLAAERRRGRAEGLRRAVEDLETVGDREGEVSVGD